MKRISFTFAITLALLCTHASRAQQGTPAIAESMSEPSGQTDNNPLPIIEDPTTQEQIREYLRVSGEEDDFRKSWIAALDKNRSVGAPYWPEAFFEAIKDEMRKTDLVPFYITLFQSGISRALMQEVLNAYHERGSEHFRGSPECFKLGEAMVPLNGEMEKLKLAKTQAVFSKVYAVYKPQIRAARARYLAEHPGWTDK
jgi:hypothetical protein